MEKAPITEFKHAEIRSEEMQEIISHVPAEVTRWGLTVIFFVLLTLIGTTWFIKYPDLLTANVVITTTPAPVSLVSRTGGKITVLKQDNQVCQKDDVVAFIQSNTDVAAVLDLEKKLTQHVTEIKAAGSLGDLQPYYSSLLNAQTAVSIFHQTAAFDKQIEQLNRQLITYQKLNKSLAVQQLITTQELHLALQKFKTDSVLYERKVTAAMDFNQSKTVWLQQQRAAKAIETTRLGNELQVNQIQKQVSDLTIQKAEQEQKLTLAFTNATNELLGQIEKWKETFLFTATGTGRIAHLGFFETDAFVEANKALFSIVPNEGKLMARAELPIRGSGKVKVGQKVNIRLENYPFEQFGLLRGTIQSISEIPSQEKYYVSIELPDQLYTSQKKNLTFKQQLSGTTEIITEDLRLLERFFYQFRSLLKRAE
jgi:multidrug efflux pump subunit AcrA (membrane-fusion protein)